MIALVTMRSSSGTDLEGSSAANRSATALARCSGDTQKTLLGRGTVWAREIGSLIGRNDSVGVDAASRTSHSGSTSVSALIDHIVIGEKLPQYSVINGDDAEILSRLSRINIFVGANNSGKSRLMRELVNWRQFPIVPHVDLKKRGAEVFSINKPE